MACLVLIRIDSESLLSGKTKGVAAGDMFCFKSNLVNSYVD